MGNARDFTETFSVAKAGAKPGRGAPLATFECVAPPGFIAI
jgi:hypothetical protein